MSDKILNSNFVLAYTLTAVFFSSGCTSVTMNEATLDRDQIRAVVRQHIRPVSACYEEAIEARPGAMGKVLAIWDVNADGAVTDVHLDEVDPSLESIRPCLTKEIGSWKFQPDPSRDTATVKYPFIFDERRPLKP